MKFHVEYIYPRDGKGYGTDIECKEVEARGDFIFFLDSLAYPVAIFSSRNAPTVTRKE